MIQTWTKYPLQGGVEGATLVSERVISSQGVFDEWFGSLPRQGNLVFYRIGGQRHVYTASWTRNSIGDLAGDQLLHFRAR